MGAWWHLGGVFRETDSTLGALQQYAVFILYLAGVYLAYMRLKGYVFVQEDRLHRLEMRSAMAEAQESSPP